MMNFYLGCNIISVLIIIDELVALPEPLCDLDLMKINKDLKFVNRLTALEDGEALVCNKTGSQHQVVRVDREGRTVPPIYISTKDSEIDSINTYGKIVVTLQKKGKITKYFMKDVSDPFFSHSITLTDRGTSYDLGSGTLIQYNKLLLPEYSTDKVFLYDTYESRDQVVITGVNRPVSVSCNQDHSVIAVCEYWGNCVSLYDRSYVKLATIRSTGEADGGLNNPTCAVFTPTDSLLVADYINSRVCEFSKQGAFIRHVLTSDHGIHKPWSLSFCHPHLWVACYDGQNVKRFKIYEK